MVSAANGIKDLLVHLLPVRSAYRTDLRTLVCVFPARVPLVSGMTATVTIRNGEPQTTSDWFQQRLASLRERLNKATVTIAAAAARRSKKHDFLLRRVGDYLSLVCVSLSQRKLG
jgi:hypothetical protein